MIFSQMPFRLMENLSAIETISLNIGSTKEGKIVVFVGPGVQLDTAHTIKLTLKRR